MGMPNMERVRIVQRMNELHRDIEIQFNTVAHWNDRVRKPEDAKIDADPDGQLKRTMEGLAKSLCNESAHKIPRADWVREIRRLAIEKYEFTPQGADKTDWQEYAQEYYLDYTPEQALAEDMSNA